MDAMPQVEEAEFDMLNAYLESDESADDCMLLSELDGFLTALVLSPSPITEDEWMPLALGSPARFASPEQRDAVLDIMRRRLGFIAATLRQDPEAYAPVFWSDEDGGPIADDWAYGFRRAMALREESWMPLLETVDDSILLAPIMALWEDVVPDEGDMDDEMDEAIGLAPELIPASVVAIYRFWYRRSNTQLS